MRKGWFIVATIAVLAGILTFPRFAGAPAFFHTILRGISEDTAPITLGFGGDMMFDRYIRVRGEAVGYNSMLQPIAPLLSNHDLTIANLEGPVTTFASVSSGTKPLEQNNYVFTFSPNIVPALAESGIDIVSLANNHVFNFGNAGLSQTKQYLSDGSISFFGEPFAVTHHVADVHGTHIGFVGFNEFFPPSEDEVISEIQTLATTTDFVVVFTHWGFEYTQHPNENQRALARKFIDAGADFVIGGHPHVIQTHETYRGKEIYYSLGNLVFDQYFEENVRCGLFVTLTLNPKDLSYTTQTTTVYLEKDGATEQKVCGEIPL